jgi:hypothetical protein
LTEFANRRIKVAEWESLSCVQSFPSTHCLHPVAPCQLINSCTSKSWTTNWQLSSLPTKNWVQDTGSTTIYFTAQDRARIEDSASISLDTVIVGAMVSRCTYGEQDLASCTREALLIVVFSKFALPDGQELLGILMELVPGESLDQDSVKEMLHNAKDVQFKFVRSRLSF